MADSIKTLYVTTRDEWRSWLDKYHTSESEVWLLYYKKHTCKPRIPYDDAVEEAICYGWIDSIIKRIDENTYCQKFTPRRKKSRWSQLNIARAKKMISEGRMTETGLMKFRETEKDPSLIIIQENRSQSLVLPQDIEAALKQNDTAWDFFRKSSISYRRMCISWIIAAKKSETRQRRIEELVEKSSEGNKIGLK
jgi:uncharacterized protein YdeI (YjbR/CyaY-like superfamily)